MGTGADWSAVRDHLATLDIQVAAPDLPGHGASVGQAASDYTMDAVSDRLAAQIGGGESAVVAGYSMGGRIALHLARRHPERVAGLVLVSASPGLRTATERAARRALDAERAAAIAADFPGFLDRWYRAPLWGGLADGLRQRLVERRLANDPAELAAVLEGLGTGAQPSHWSGLSDLPGPAWALTGSRDTKYVQIVREMAEAGPIQPVIVPDAGHALLDEAPAAVADALRAAVGSNARRLAFPPPTDSL